MGRLCNICPPFIYTNCSRDIVKISPNLDRNVLIPLECIKHTHILRVFFFRVERNFIKTEISEGKLRLTRNRTTSETARRRGVVAVRRDASVCAAIVECVVCPGLQSWIRLHWYSVWLCTPIHFTIYYI